LVAHLNIHSRKIFFNEKFENENIDAHYENYELKDLRELAEIVASTPNLRGLNVTIPYKEKIIPYLQELSNDAKAIGAVNVIRVMHKGKKIVLKGFNSDAIAFKQSIEPLLRPFHQKALILGTGGAAKAVRYALEELGLETLYVSRTKKQDAITYEQVTPEIVNEYNVIVNCTPVGLYPNTDECPTLPYESMTPRTLLYDLLYNPDETLFMLKGAEHGAVCKNGLEMLLLQAFVSWDIWQDKI